MHYEARETAWRNRVDCTFPPVPDGCPLKEKPIIVEPEREEWWRWHTCALPDHYGESPLGRQRKRVKEERAEKARRREIRRIEKETKEKERKLRREAKEKEKEEQRLLRLEKLKAKESERAEKREQKRRGQSPSTKESKEE
jgi:hypothetical protein